MIQLALETTGKTGSLAILEGESVLWSRAAGTEQRTAGEFAVGLDEAMKWCDQQSRQLEFVSVAVGPGSFTGLRIAVTTAKTFAYARNLPIIPVGSLIAIAANTPRQDDCSVLVGLNAYRNQVFAAEFDADCFGSAESLADSLHRAEVIGRDHWTRRLEQLGPQKKCVATGDAGVFPDAQAGSFVRRDQVDAVGVGRVAALLAGDRQITTGDFTTDSPFFCDAFSLVARYLKPSAAEEKATSR